MQYLKENKKQLLVYLEIIFLNVLTYIFISFYFKNMEYNFLIMFFVIALIDFLLLNIKDKIKCNLWLDFFTCLIIGLIIGFIEKDMLVYSTILFSLYLSNNLMFVQTRKHNKFFKNTLEYILIMMVMLFAMFINIWIKMSLV